MFKALLALLLLASTGVNATPSRNLTIFAESNISIPLTKIARQYSRATNVIVSLNFTQARNLMDDIDNGEPVDLFISANSNWIEMLHQKGVADIYNVGYIAQDELVIVSQKNNSKLPRKLQEEHLPIAEVLKILNQNNTTVIIDESGNSSGFFARKFLKQFDLKNTRIFSRISEDRMPLLRTISKDKENYSILLNSQIHNKKNFQILAKSDQKIFYQGLVIAGDNMEVAREFLKFLKSKQAKDHMLAHGFLVN